MWPKELAVFLQFLFAFRRARAGAQRRPDTQIVKKGDFQKNPNFSVLPLEGPQKIGRWVWAHNTPTPISLFFGGPKVILKSNVSKKSELSTPESI